MKKLFTIILVLTITVMCVGCSKRDNDSAKDQAGANNGNAAADNSQLERAQAAIDAGNYDQAYKILYDDNFRSKEEEALFAKLVYVPITVTSTSGSVVKTFAYDNNGNLLKAVEDDDTTTYTYDAQGNLLCLEKEYNGYFSHRYTYTYDANGNRLTQLYEGSDDNWEKYTYTYDEAGNQLTQRFEDSDGDWHAYVYTYDDKGDQLTSQYADSTGAEHTTTYTYTYNDQGKRIRRDWTSTDGATGSNTYDTSGRTTGYYKEDADGRWSKVTGIYDSNGNQLEYTEERSEKGVVVHFTCTYDKNGKLLELTGGRGFPMTKTFTYDSNGNRISGEGFETEPTGAVTNYSCTYDDHSNITVCKVENTYFNRNQTYKYAYDENGVVTTAMCTDHATEDRTEYTYGYTFTYQLFYYPDGVPTQVDGINLVSHNCNPLAVMLQTIKP